MKKTIIIIIIYNAHINNSKLNHYETNFLNSFRNPKIKEEIEEKEKTNFLNHFTEYCNQFYPLVSKFDLSLSLIINQTNSHKYIKAAGPKQLHSNIECLPINSNLKILDYTLSFAKQIVQS